MRTFDAREVSLAMLNFYFMALTIAGVARLALLALIVLMQPAPAHEHWINQQRLEDPETGGWCCNDKDCAEVPVGGVAETAGGYRIAETGETIPYARIIWKSPDGAWWRCRYEPGQFVPEGKRAGDTRCLIGPPPGS